MSGTKRIPLNGIWILAFAIVGAFILNGLLFSLDIKKVAANNVLNRSITIGSSRPAALTTHDFKFDLETPGTLGSIELEYCTNDPFPGTPCTAPSGMSMTTAVLSSQSGEANFSIAPTTTDNKIILSRTPAAAAAGTVTYDFSNVINPLDVNTPIYVRISTFASNDASGSLTDRGGVVFDLTTGLGVGAFVAPKLELCVGSVVALDCSNQVHDIKSLGDLTPSTTGFTTTEFSVATNDVGGYNIFILGNSLTSGNNIIPALASQSTSKTGTGQFGMNLVANSSPSIGTNPIGVGTGVVATGYNSSNLYKFQAGDIVASSQHSTDYTLFTVSYIANIDKSQPAGIYDTTMTYVAVVAF